MKKSDLYCGRNLIYGITESSRWLPQQCCEPYTPPRHVNAAANSARLRSPERMGRHTTATSDLLHPLMLSYRANANHQPPFREFLHLTPRWLKATNGSKRTRCATPHHRFFPFSLSFFFLHARPY